jgi:hypothetical protein
VRVVGPDKDHLALSDGLAGPFIEPVNNRATWSYLACGDSAPLVHNTVTTRRKPIDALGARIKY